MNRRTFPALIALLLLAAILSALPAFTAAEDYRAGAMRLLRFDGDVEILNSEGVPRFVMENVRFDSGEAMHTGEASSASVGLDDAKIVTLDADTRVQFLREDSHIRLNLTEGAVFVDVSEKLDENESFDIQTTTMTVGIRGTLIYVKTEPGSPTAPGSGAPATTIGILEGAGRIDYQDTSGTRRVFDVEAGKKVTLTESAESEAAAAPVLTDLAPADLNSFVGDLVRGDEELANRVINGSPDGELLLSGSDDEGGSEINPHPAGGDWTWPMEIQLVAQSASKLYDGRPLRRTSGVLVYGLPADCSIRVSSEGSRTDAGQASNEISDYAIFNSAGENVTSHFTNIVKVPGVLRVDPAPLTVWTGSAEKVYDGEPLTCEDAEIRTVPGRVAEEPEWRNTSIVTRSPLGTESMIGVSGSVWVHGANPLTGEVREVMLGTGQRLSVSLTNEDGKDSIAFTVETLTVDEIPDDVLHMYAQNPDLMAQAVEDTGWDADALQKRVESLESPGAATVKQNGLSVPAAVKDDVLTDSSNVRINIDSNVTDYNTRPLTEDEAHFAPITLDPSIKVTATGSQTAVGESENTYEVDWGNADKNNYEIIFDPGTLKVTPLDLDVNIGGGAAVYSGAAYVPNPSLTYLNGPHAGEKVTGTRHSAEAAASDTPLDSGLTYDFLLFTGDTVTLTISGMGSAPGVYTLTGSVRVSSENVGSVGVTYSNATVTIEPAVLEITTGSAKKEYDGKPLTSSRVEVTGLAAGESVRVEAAGSQTEVGVGRNTYRFWWDTANPDCYTVREHIGALEVTAAPVTVTITGKKAAETYTGETFRAEGYEVSISNPLYTAADFTFSGEAAAEGAAPGVYPMGLNAGRFKNTNGNFDVTFKVTDGSLEITANDAPITVTAASASKPYDGVALTANEVNVSGLPEGFTCAAETAGSQRLPGSADNVITSCKILDKNGADATANFTNITTVPGLLTVTKNDTPITIQANDEEWVYDGEEKYGFGSCTVTGLPEGVHIMAEVSGLTAKNAGTYTLTPSWYMYDDESGIDHNECFSDITEKNGTLTVHPLQISIDVQAGPAEFGSFPDLGNPSAAYGNGGHEGESLVEKESESVPGRIQKTWTLFTGSDLSVTVSANSVDAGEHTLDCSYSLGSSTASNYEISFENTGYTITPKAVTITTGSAEKYYDGTPLTNDEVTVDGLCGAPETAYTEDQLPVFTATGSQTEIGSSDNTYTVSWGAYKQTNYTITDSLGTLTVTVHDEPVTFTAESDWKDYDGTPLVADPANIEVTGLPAGYTWTAEVTGSQTNGGIGTFHIASYKIFSETGADVTPIFTNVTTVDGELQIVPVEIWLNLMGDPTDVYVYNGHPVLPNSIEAKYGADESDITRLSLTTDGGEYPTTMTAVFSLLNGDQMQVVCRGITDAGGHEYAPVITFPASAAENYNVSLILANFVKILPVDVELYLGGTVGSSPYVYDGTFHGGLLAVNSDMGRHGEQTGDFSWTVHWDTGETMNVSITGGGTDAGEYTLTGSCEFTSGKKDNFDVRFDNNIVTISPATLYVYTEDDEKEYDGTALTNPEASYEGLVNEETIEITATGSATHVSDSGTKNTCKITWGTAKSRNYTINEEGLGTLTITPVRVRFDGIHIADDEYDLEITSTSPCEKTPAGKNAWVITWPWGESFDVYLKDAETGTFDSHNITETQRSDFEIVFTDPDGFVEKE